MDRTCYHEQNLLEGEEKGGEEGEGEKEEGGRGEESGEDILC